MNNQAIVSRVSEVIQIPGADNVQISVVLGENCVTSKNVKQGDIGILFPEGLQLSEQFVYENNLSRNKEKNKSPDKTGFFEDSRRVRAQPFLKIRSTGLFMPLESVAFTGVSVADLQIGVQFNDLNGINICKKYMNEKTMRAAGNNKVKAAKKTYAPNFKEHVDTTNFNYANLNNMQGSVIYFHSKKHGTSGRTSYTQVVKELPWWKRAINKIANQDVFPDFSWEVVTGTRRVVLKNDEEGKEGFHGSEEFRFQITEKLKPFMQKGMTIYYEIVGFANGKPIMPEHSVKDLKDKEYTKKYGDKITYKYGCMPGTNKFHIYRITMQGADGEIRDFSQAQLERWCMDRELPYTNEVHGPMVYDGNETALRELVKNLTEREDVLTEDFEDASHVSEGVIIRIENGGMAPQFFKSKSYAFRVMEGLCEAEDTEDAA